MMEGKELSVPVNLFDRKLIDTLIGGLEPCDGELKQAIYEIIIARTSRQPGKKKSKSDVRSPDKQKPLVDKKSRDSVLLGTGKWKKIATFLLSRDYREQENRLRELYEKSYPDTILIKEKKGGKVIARGVIHHSSEWPDHKLDKGKSYSMKQLFQMNPDGTLDEYVGIKITAIRRPGRFEKYCPGVKIGDVMVEFLQDSTDISRFI